MPPPPPLPVAIYLRNMQSQHPLERKRLSLYFVGLRTQFIITAVAVEKFRNKMPPKCHLNDEALDFRGKTCEQERAAKWANNSTRDDKDAALKSDGGTKSNNASNCF